MRRAILLSGLALAGCQFIPGTDAGKIAEAHKAVASQLNDPGSAQFRNDRVNLATGSPYVCGEVNSKNAMGGYSGFQRYVLRVGDNSMLIGGEAHPPATVFGIPNGCEADGADD